MGYLSAVALRQAVQAQLVADLTGYKRSIYPFDLFPAAGRPAEHKAFAVGLGDTVPYVATDRQRPNYGTPVQTDVQIAYTLRLRADNLVADYHTALTAEQQIVESVFNTTNASLMALTLLRCSRSVELEGNLYRGLVEVRAYHRLQMRD